MTRLVLAAATLACLCVQAMAQPWTERPYNPEIGSRWSIISQTDSDEVRPGGPPRDQHVRVRGEFSIDEKLPDGFRITYVNRELLEMLNGSRRLRVVTLAALLDVDAAALPPFI